MCYWCSGALVPVWYWYSWFLCVTGTRVPVLTGALVPVWYWYSWFLGCGITGFSLKHSSEALRLVEEVTINVGTK